MKRRPLTLSLALVVTAAVLAPPSALAALQGWYYRAQCNGAITDFVPAECPDEAIANNQLVRVTLPAGAGPTTFGGVDLQFIAPKLPKNGVGFQSLTIRGDDDEKSSISPNDVWVVLYFTQGPPVVATLSQFTEDRVRSCLLQATITSADLPGTGSRVVNRVRVLVRGNNSNCSQSLVIGRVGLTQYFASGISPTLWTSVNNVCNSPRPPVVIEN